MHETGILFQLDVDSVENTGLLLKSGVFLTFYKNVQSKTRRPISSNLIFTFFITVHRKFY